jgi:hypothetical protein
LRAWSILLSRTMICKEKLLFEAAVDNRRLMTCPPLEINACGPLTAARAAPYLTPYRFAT